jgi:hypothetical protein
MFPKTRWFGKASVKENLVLCSSNYQASYWRIDYNKQSPYYTVWLGNSGAWPIHERYEDHEIKQCGPFELLEWVD